MSHVRHRIFFAIRWDVHAHTFAHTHIHTFTRSGVYTHTQLHALRTSYHFNGIWHFFGLRHTRWSRWSWFGMFQTLRIAKLKAQFPIIFWDWFWVLVRLMRVRHWETLNVTVVNWWVHTCLCNVCRWYGQVSYHFIRLKILFSYKQSISWIYPSICPPVKNRPFSTPVLFDSTTYRIL